MPYQEIQALGFPNSPRKLGLYEKPWACISWYGPCTQLVNSNYRFRAMKSETIFTKTTFTVLRYPDVMQHFEYHWWFISWNIIVHTNELSKIKYFIKLMCYFIFENCLQWLNSTFTKLYEIETKWIQLNSWNLKLAVCKKFRSWFPPLFYCTIVIN